MRRMTLLSATTVALIAVGCLPEPKDRAGKDDPGPGTAAQPEAPSRPGARVDYQAELPVSPDGRPPRVPGFDEIPDGAFGDAVRRGKAIFDDTPKHAGEFVGNTLSCANCHIDSGRKADSAPMWGAWTMYPAYRKKNDRVNTLEERLRGCFTYSMNAPASPASTTPPPGDPILNDLQAYIFWMAQGLPTAKAMPGRGYPEFDKPEDGYSAERGAAVYKAQCAICHGDDGAGLVTEFGQQFPPLWGAESYNWGAGMHRINTSAAFIRANMPLGKPNSLTEQEAWDVAAYINSRPRPADPRQKGELRVADEQFHQHECSYGESVDEVILGTGAIDGDPG